MLPGESSKRSVPPALGSGGCIDALPDGVLGHILGFLPAPEAVRTCVLAPRWRHLWNSATSLRVGCYSEDAQVEEQRQFVVRLSEDQLPPVKEHREFVDHLLLLRGSSQLDLYEFHFSEFKGKDVPPVNLWFRHVVMCGARVLRLHLFSVRCLELDDLSLVSKHLTTLDLRRVTLQNSFLNFSSCPALEHLELFSSVLTSAEKIVSKSLKHLSLTDCIFHHLSRIYISTPSLVSLHLDSFDNMTPIFDIMPSLVKAFVRINYGYGDICEKPDNLDCICLLCGGSNSRGSSLLLKGLSQAKSLLLTSHPDMIPFKIDLRWCPIFSNLKTLLLNDYCCTLEFFPNERKYIVEMKGRCNLMEKSAKISENLNIVEVKCHVVDDRVLKVLKFLCTFNISSLVPLLTE